MTVMAILQDVDKCMRCNGCVICVQARVEHEAADDIAGVHRRSLVGHRALAIKSQKRGRHGSVHALQLLALPRSPLRSECPFEAIKKEANGAVSVDQSPSASPNLCMACDRAAR